MSLAQANKNLKFDNRMTERNVSIGEMTNEELKKHLESLPDMAHNTETFTVDGKNSSHDDDDTH